MGIELLKKIRQEKGLNPYRMAKELDISLPRYQYLERTAKTLPLKVLVDLFWITEMEIDDFWKLIMREVREKDQ